MSAKTAGEAAGASRHLGRDAAHDLLLEAADLVVEVGPVARATSLEIGQRAGQVAFLDARLAGAARSAASST